MTTETSRPASAPTNTGRRSRRAQADHRGRDRGQDQHALEALAEDDDRRVGDDRGLVGGVAERRGGVGELAVEREPRLADRRAAAARLAICLARPSWPAAPNQIRPSMSSARPWSKRAQAALGAELEERVGLQARLLGLAVLAGAGGGLHAVEREPDQVVVGLVGLLASTAFGIAAVSAVCGLRRRPSATCSWRRRRPRLLLGATSTSRPSSVSAAAAAVGARRGRAWRAGRAGRANAPTAPVRKATASCDLEVARDAGRP